MIGQWLGRFVGNWLGDRQQEQETAPSYGGIFSRPSRKDQARVKKWLEKLLIKPVIVEAKGEASFSFRSLGVGFGISPNPRITPFTVSEGVKRPLLSLKSPKKPKKAQPDTRLIAARKAEAMRLAKRKVEEEALLLALI